MSEQQHDRMEERLRSAAGSFRYPPTPDIAGEVTRRLTEQPARRRVRSWPVARSALIAVLVLGVLMAVPPVRAAVIEVIRIGAVRVFVDENPPTALPTTAPTQARPAATPTRPTAPTRVVAVDVSPTAELTPAPTATPRLAEIGETTLEYARRRVPFPIRLPAYPKDLGRPDRVVVNDLGGAMVTLIWEDPKRPGRDRLALYALECRECVLKKQVSEARRTEVNGRPAVWTQGPHLLEMLGPGGANEVRIVGENVLIWTVGRVTYRLESDLSMKEAVRVAESVR